MIKLSALIISPFCSLSILSCIVLFNYFERSTMLNDSSRTHWYVDRSCLIITSFCLSSYRSIVFSLSYFCIFSISTFLIAISPSILLLSFLMSLMCYWKLNLSRIVGLSGLRDGLFLLTLRFLTGDTEVRFRGDFVLNFSFYWFLLPFEPILLGDLELSLLYERAL